jgi:hypothetical protein
VNISAKAEYAICAAVAHLRRWRAWPETPTPASRIDGPFEVQE